jgi:phytoene/squalene synthetase
MKDLFEKVSLRCSRITTQLYSTSFSLGIYCLHKRLRDPIYAIYGFVRFADEIVDTFHDFNKEDLLARFKDDTYRAIDEHISLNPILQSFQLVVNRYKIEPDLISQFLKSMEMDLRKTSYDSSEIKEYIAGSAEVVGLMCLRVFCEGNADLFDKLSPYARKLGSAFQKVNFLRDLNADFHGLGRIYFPSIKMNQWNTCSKMGIERTIEEDFEEALEGVKKLPRSSRLGVYVAYVYYRSLLKKIKNTSAELVCKKRIRIPNGDKARLLAYSYVKHQLNLI